MSKRSRLKKCLFLLDYYNRNGHHHNDLLVHSFPPKPSAYHNHCSFTTDLAHRHTFKLLSVKPDRVPVALWSFAHDQGPHCGREVHSQIRGTSARSALHRSQVRCWLLQSKTLSPNPGVLQAFASTHCARKA